MTQISQATRKKKERSPEASKDENDMDLPMLPIAAGSHSRRSRERKKKEKGSHRREKKKMRESINNDGPSLLFTVFNSGELRSLASPRSRDLPPPPLTPGELRIAPMRQATPPLEAFISLSSPSLLQETASMLYLLRSRRNRLNAQVEGFEVAGRKAKASLYTVRLQRNDRDKTKADICTFEEVIALMSEHSTDIFVLEHALRDIVDEGTGDEDKKLKEHLGDAKTMYQEMLRMYNEKLLELMNRLQPEVLQRTIQELKMEGKKSEGGS
ncbi:hypothetical protein BU26DRAFT_151821 [Trematosphaeria pertusa]|uniref:Uncharacterized protein n=1 Tax=Trematosphaeria pertusa TaxID=390896 RepID=A0A6A6IXA8_9PLEO|nr:uncharacterized protein BU26DRAFT_151821 [Trematosphaeria pertusa]KAF2255185.1 hypothetical protein BU26DRAFT_151821 [Trematosphaeria pertusa]